MSEHVEKVAITLAQQALDRYPRIAFEVPPGTTSFEVRLEGSEHIHGLVVDLGCEGPTGWCGWSGGARRSFVITETDATPGYLPGVPAGTWHVVLGLHTVPAAGAEVIIRITFPARSQVDHGPLVPPVAREQRGSSRNLPAPGGMRWFAGDMHAHSLHSDGALSLDELAREAVLSGLDFLAVTDHNTTSHHPQLASVGRRHGITLLPGQEITTHRGHANAYGEIGFIDFRKTAQHWVHDVEARGGWMSVNHPVSGDCSWLHPLKDLPAGVELYHGSWFQEPNSTSVLAWEQRWDNDAVLIGGGDFHNRTTPLRPGMPTTWIAAIDDSAEALLAGLRAGRTTITAGAAITDQAARPDLMATPVLLRQGGELLALAAQDLVLVSGVGDRRLVVSTCETLTAPLAQGPYRLEDAERRVLALVR